MNFDELCDVRGKVGEKKYDIWHCECGLFGIYNFGRHYQLDASKGWCSRLPELFNAAIYRNCALDVAEELADAVNILTLWKRKGISADLSENLDAVMDELRDTGEWLLKQEGKDEYHVERIGF